MHEIMVILLFSFPVCSLEVEFFIMDGRSNESTVDPSLDYFSILYYEFWLSHRGREDGVLTLHCDICHKDSNNDNMFIFLCCSCDIMYMVFT